MATIALLSVSLEDYLSNPAYKHCEYVAGQVVPLHVGKRDHSGIQVICASLLHAWNRRHKLGFVGTELHCHLTIRGQASVRLPDVAFVSRPFTSGYLEGAPDLVVEIRSPDDSVGTLFQKADDYLANGAHIVWIIDPLEAEVFVLTPCAAARILKHDDVLSGGHVLPGLEFPVSEFFTN